MGWGCDISETLEKPTMMSTFREHRKVLIAIFIVAAVFFSAIFTLYPSLNPLLHDSFGSEGEVWSKWGMRIEHPVGLEARYEGIIENEVNEHSGSVSWVWCEGGKTLRLWWFEGMHDFDHEEWFENMIEEYKKNAEISNFEIIKRSQMSIDEHLWQYVIFSYESKGEVAYTTLSTCFYEDKDMFYFIFYASVEPESPDEMMRFPSTFKTN